MGHCERKEKKLGQTGLLGKKRVKSWEPVRGDGSHMPGSKAGYVLSTRGTTLDSFLSSHLLFFFSLAQMSII